MTPSQTALYFREWGKYRKALIERGMAPKAADAERKAATIRALGSDKSSKAFTNAELTQVLTMFRAMTGSDLLAVINANPEAQEAIRCRYVCRQLLAQIGEIDPAEHRTAAEADGYINGTFRNILGYKPSDFGDDHEAWAKVIAALKYRYDQVCRARLGLSGAKQYKRYWPHNHDRNLAEVAAHCGDIAPPPNDRYREPGDDDQPF